MRKVVVSEFVTLDGVMEAPHKWSFPYWTDEIGKFKNDELSSSDALLLGRITYEGFAAAWPNITSEGEYAEWMNGYPKYVASTTLENPNWNNSTVIKGNVGEEVSKLKEQVGKDILIFGSAALTNSLIQDGLIDEYRLLVYPIVLGSGKALFDDRSKVNLKLVDTKSYDTGVVILTYQPA